MNKKNTNLVVTEIYVSSKTSCLTNIYVSGELNDENGKSLGKKGQEIRGFAYRERNNAKRGIKKAIRRAFACQGVTIDDAKLDNIAMMTLIK